jgi:pimeloyl-ACP methyl ester carboxylesterase
MRRQMAERAVSILFLVLLPVMALFAGTAAAEDRHAEESRWSVLSDLVADGKGFEGVVDPARAYFASPQFQQLLNAPAGELEKSLDTVVTLEHDLPVGGGRTMRVQEHFTLRSWLRWPHRGILMMSSSAFNRKTFTIPVEGYNATEMFAQRGFFAFTVDYFGIGESYHPESGWDANRDEDIPALKKVLKYIRAFRLIPKVDILGEGYGSTMAPELAADAHRVRSLLMSSTIYKLVGPFGPGTNPGFNDFLLNDEDGYIPIPGEAYLAFMADFGTPQEVIDFHFAEQAGEYPAPIFGVQEVFPFFDPGVARVPGLIIYGLRDTQADPQDPFELAADYGTDGAPLILLETAGHAPRVESPEVAAMYWAEVFRFFDPE